MTDRRRSFFVLLIVLGLLAASIAVIVSRPTKLGLDLKGGVELVYQAKPTKQQPQITSEAVQRSIDIMRERVDALGVSEPEIQRSGRDQIVVSLPDVTNAERAEEQVGTTAQLYLYDWEKNLLDEDCKTNPDQSNGGQAPITGLYNAVKRASKCPAEEIPSSNAAGASRFYAFDKTSKRPYNGGQPAESREAAVEDLTSAQRENAEVLEVKPGILVVRDETPADGPPPDRWWILRDDPALTGTDIKDPKQEFDQRGGNQPIVTFGFTGRGRDAFQNTTRTIAERGADNAFPGTSPEAAAQHFAIVLDNELVSTPFINFRENPDGIDGSSGAQISGGFNIQTAQDLAKILEIGALPVELDLISRSQVSATLGQAALDQGLTAAVAGFIVVALFLLLFYRVLGVVAVAALAIYAIYFFALVKLIPVTLTLPGIAGAVLTLGVAADANIVIFERVKEEVRAGRSITAAISAGYKKGFSTILDANVVTLLVAFILFILATAGVKGFALLLGLGTLVSLFTAVVATQAILLTLKGSRLLRSPSALGAGEQKRRIRFDFMGASKWFFSMSGVILLIGGLAIAGKGLNFGIDFESGTRVTAALQQSATVDQVRGVLERGGLADAKIQTVTASELGPNVVQVATKQLAPNRVDDSVTNPLDEAFGVVGQPEIDAIGPTFGETVANSALIAIIASLIVIGAYIALRFEWKYAVPVLIALMHDLLITAGVYSLTDREVTTSTVAALLTILGFSLYDTIIVFDRVRENVPRMPNAAFAQIVNRSMSEVIVRSMATSFCTLLPVVALYFFGGETLKDFAFALIVGTLSGTYSSIFIASPVLCLWKGREPVYRARERRLEIEFDGHVPAYAVATAGGAPVDVAPTPRGGRRGRVTAPEDPSQVSRDEFDDLVRNLGVEEDDDTRPPARPAPTTQPRGGRRAARANGAPRPSGQGPKAGEPGADGEKPKKPRNRRHGRPR